MNFLKRLLGIDPAPMSGQDPKPIEQDAPVAPPSKALEPEIDTVTLTGNGRYDLEVVGESFYQENLERICGPRTEDGENRKVTAHLVLDDGNRYDDQAVRVEIDGLQVGHLSRDIARWYRGVLKENGHARPIGIVGAKIRGGWRREGEDDGHYGVWLDIPVE